MATTSAIPAAELIHRLPDPDDIRRRLIAINTERQALASLLRSIEAAERRRKRLEAAAEFRKRGA